MKNAICYLFSFLVEAIIIWQYTSNLFVSKRSSKTKFVVLCSLYFVLFVISLFESEWLNAVIYFIANYIFLITQCELKWNSAFFHSSILIAVMGMCELLAYGIFKYFRPHFLENGRDFLSLLIFAIFNKLIFFTVIFILTYLFRGRRKDGLQNDKSVCLLIFIPLTSVFVMLTFISIDEVVNLLPPYNWMITLSAAFLLLSNLLVFGINQYTQKKSMEFTEMQLLLQKESNSTEYYEMLRLQNENQRILIHDIKKHLQSIDMLNNNKAYDKISAYINQLMLSSELQEVARLCDHEMLNSILCRYMHQCNKRHIAFHVDIRSGTTNFISDNDITSLFCNLLDNAMEAANNIPNAFIEISTSKRENTSFTVITVINSCEKDPFADKNGTLITSKSDKRRHGFGIKSIHKAVKKYCGDVNMYYNSDTLTFHTIITLKAQHL